jgi:hypothetical protein
VQELENHPLGLWTGIQKDFLREIEHANDTSPVQRPW